MNHKITPGLPGAGRVNTEFVWTDEVRVQDELARLHDEVRRLRCEVNAWRWLCVQLSVRRGDRA